MEQTRFLQSDFWAAFKSAHGWHAIKNNGISILVRSFRLGVITVSIAYVPLAPEYYGTEESYTKQLAVLGAELKKILPKHTLCIRFDIPKDLYTCKDRSDCIKKITEAAKSQNCNLLKTRVDVQPPDTVLLELSKSEDELLSAMKPKWRYNIRLAQKKGVTIHSIHADDENFEQYLHVFYDLYKTTAERDGIGIHPLSYYRDLLKRGCPGTGATVTTLYLAEHEKDNLAAIITLFCPRESVYLFGCSGNVKRNLMPAYLLQWTAICDAKKYGSPVYDFYGIPPTDDINHPMHGLYLFKTGFGGIEIHRPGSFDIPLDVLYQFYIIAERLRAFWHKKVLKKIRGR